MSSDPLDHLQSMFPSIDGDVIAIVFAESDKDVSSTVEKLLQLVPSDESKREFSSLFPSVQPSLQQYPILQRLSPSPRRSASEPASASTGSKGQPATDTFNSAWQDQSRNRRLQGPTHIPPNIPKQPRSGGGMVDSVGGGQQKIHSQQNDQLYKGQQQSQSILGKRSATGNQKRVAASHSNTGSAAGSGGVRESGNQEPFYQMGGSSVNSMPGSLVSLDPFYHQAAALQQRQPQALSRSNNYPPQFQPQQQRTPVSYISQTQPSQQQQLPRHHQTHLHQQQKQWQSSMVPVTAPSASLYGYPNMRLVGDQFYDSSWMDQRQGSSDYAEQFYAQGQQNWPNIGESELGYGEPGVDRTRNPLTKISGGYPPPPGITGLLGAPHEQTKSDWPLYSSSDGGSGGGGGGGGMGTIGDRSGNMDAILALLQPERTSSNSLGRHGPSQNEPPLSNVATPQQHQQGESQRGARHENYEQREVAPTSKEGKVGRGGTSDKSKGTAARGRDSERKTSEGNIPKKLIILRGLPGSGKTTLARSLVGTDGTICCTDDFFVRNGQYIFDPSLLDENHEKNRTKARGAMESGRSPVVIDNTNTNAWEMKPYVLLAMKNGYDVQILEPDTPWRFKTAELARRNSHGVPRQRLEKMLERYDHRVTLESIIVSQQPEKKQTKPTNSEPSRSASGGRQNTNGGQKGGTRTKVSPPTPRQQQQIGNDDVDHTPSHQKHVLSTANQNLSGGASGGQRSNGRPVSPRPGSQRGQSSSVRAVSPGPIRQRGHRSKESTSGKSGTEHHQHHMTNESDLLAVSDGRSGDSRRKDKTQRGSNHNQNTTTAASLNNKSQAELSRKGRRAALQTTSKTTLSSAAASNRKRSVSPGKGPVNKKQSSQNRGKQNDKRGYNGVAGKHSGGESEAVKEEEKKSTEGEEAEEEEEDEFLWDSSEETEILDPDGIGIGNGPVFMTDTPPVEASFRPIPHVGKTVVNGDDRHGVSETREEEALRGHLEQEPQRTAPIFEVWKDSDDEEIDNRDEGVEPRGREGVEEEDENPLPVAWLGRGQKGRDEAQHLPRTTEVTNIKQEVDEGVMDSSSGSMLAPPSSHPWERTQSASNIKCVNSHFMSLIRRVQSANPVQSLGSLTESEGDGGNETNDDSFNVFAMSSVWGSENGLLSSKVQLFDSAVTLSIEPIDSIVKSSPSVQSVDSSDSQQEKLKKVQSSYYSMLDALTEEMAEAEDMNIKKENDDAVNSLGVETGKVDVTKVGAKLLDEAISSTQGSLKNQEAIEDELKCPLRSKLTAALVIETKSLKVDEEKEMTEKESHTLETTVDVEILVPRYPSGEQDSSPLLPPFNENSAFFLEGCKPFKEDFLVDLSTEEQGSSLEMLTEEVFDQDQLCPDKNLSTLQTAFRAVADLLKKESDEEMMSSQFAAIGDIGRPPSLNAAVSFEDPAIVSKVHFEEEGDSKRSPLIIQSLQKVYPTESKSGEDSKKKPSLLASLDQGEPLDVFPSAYDEGMTVNFELSAVTPRMKLTEEEDKSRSSSREQTQSDLETPFQSLTPVNDLSLVSACSTIMDGRGSRCGLEQANGPASIEEEKEEVKNLDKFSSAPESIPTHTTLDELHLDDGYLVGTSCVKDDSNSDSDLRFLTECFPGLEESYLFAIFNMCDRNVEDALSVLLFSHSNQNGAAFDLNFFDSQTGTDTTDDASSTVSSVSYSDQYPIQGFPGQQSDSSYRQEMTSSTADYPKATFSVGGYEDESYDEEAGVGERSFMPYFGQSNECIDDEEIARALQEQLDLEASSNETSSVGKGSDVIETVDQRERTSSHGSNEAPPTSSVGENLELKLSASLARQLQEMFGSVLDHLPFEGEMREEDMVVLLSERAAREIYKKWLDTLHAKKIGYRVQSEIIMTKDEALARQLQEEEDSRVREKQSKKKKHKKFRHLTEPSSLSTLAAENYRTHHNSSPPQLGHRGASAVVSGSPQTGGGLVDIMGEQMAQQIQENDLAEVVKEKARPNLSLKLQLKELYKQFPELEQPRVNRTLVNNKFDIEATVTELKFLVSHPPPPSSVKESTDGNAFGGMQRSGSKSSSKNVRGGARGCGQDSKAKRKLLKDDGKESKNNEKDTAGAKDEDGVEKQQPSYIELRAESALHAKLRAENFLKAAHARGRKQWEVAQYYAQQGHLHTEKMNEANQRAAKATLEHNYTSSDELDLHGLHVDEAIAALQEKLTSCKGSKLRVVTGQGIHSKGGGARIRPAVIDYLKQKRYKIVYEKNAGALTVKIKGVNQ